MNSKHRPNSGPEVRLLLTLVVVAASLRDAVAREPVPIADRQQQIAKLLDNTYELGRLDGVAKKQVAINKLVRALNDTELGADEHYVVLTSLISLTKDLSDADVFLLAVSKLTAEYDVDPMKEKGRLLGEYLRSTKSGTDIELVIDEAIETAYVAAKDNRFQDASGLLGVADSAVRRVASTDDLKKSVVSNREIISVWDKDWKAFEAAKTRLASRKDDPAANLAVGKWHAVYQYDWETALPLLAKSSDAKWKAAAILEQSPSSDAAGYSAIGDAWYELAQKETIAVKAALLWHAGEWYERAEPKLPAGLAKQLITKRRVEIASAESPIRTKPLEWKRPEITIPPLSEPDEPGEWIDLLALTEDMEWKPWGTDWDDFLQSTPKRDALTIKAKPFARFPLEGAIHGDYELELEFTRHEGIGACSVHFPVGIHTMHLEIAGGFGSIVAYVDGKGVGQRPDRFASNQRHRLGIRVHHDGKQAKFGIDWNGAKDYILWEGPYASLTDIETPPWKTNMPGHIWLGCWGSLMTYHSARVRILSGELTRVRISEATREEDLRKGLIRLVGVKPNASEAGLGWFRVNQLPLEGVSGWVDREWPLIGPQFRVCDDFYGAHAPSRVTARIPADAKSFSVIGYNCSSGTSKNLILVDGVEVYDAGTTRIAPIKVDLPEKAKLIELVIDQAGDPFFDRSYWCWPRFHAVPADRITDAMVDAKPGSMKFIPASNTVGYGKLTHNQPTEQAKTVPVHFRDAVPCHEFIFAHAPSTVTYPVPKGMTRFTAIGYNVMSESTRFEVWVNGALKFQSPPAGIVPINVELPSGAKSIELKVNDMGNNASDRSLWCYPRLHRK